MTLGRFLYRYVYLPTNKSLLNRVFVPLGLRKYVKLRTSISLLLLFIVSGIWHGAGWTFIVFGLLNGLAMVAHRLWKKRGFKLRATNFADALKVLKGMFGMNGIILPVRLEDRLSYLPAGTWLKFSDFTMIDVHHALLYLLASFIIILCFKNSVQLLNNFKPKFIHLLFSFILLMYALLNLTKVSEFLYFNF